MTDDPTRTLNRCWKCARQKPVIQFPLAGFFQTFSSIDTKRRPEIVSHLSHNDERDGMSQHRTHSPRECATRSEIGSVGRQSWYLRWSPSHSLLVHEPPSKDGSWRLLQDSWTMFSLWRNSRGLLHCWRHDDWTSVLKGAKFLRNHLVKKVSYSASVQNSSRDAIIR